MKPRSLKELKRRGPQREANKTVLIVCEGSETEPRYLLAMVRDYGVHGDVEVTGDCGSAPISVVDKAIKLFNANESYDFVYCVFDRDAHPTYQQALDKVASHPLQRKVRGRVEHSAVFEAITSTPCFEFWVMLHYSSAAAPMRNFAELLPRLRRLPGFESYDKGALDLYARLKDKTEAAIRNAMQVEVNAQATGALNPMTRMHKLVADLGALRKRF